MSSVKDFCESQKSIAYISALNGIEIKAIEYGIDDYVYCVSNAWAMNKDLRRYHHVKIHYEFALDREETRPYIKILGADRKYEKYYLDEAIRMEVNHEYF